MKFAVAAAALLLAACHLTPQQAVIVNDAEALACVLAEAEVSPNTAELIAQVCGIPVSQVIDILAAKHQADAKAALYFAERARQCR